MEKIKELHSLGLEVRHEFDVFEKIDFYYIYRKNKFEKYQTLE